MADELPFHYGVWLEFPFIRPANVTWITLNEGFFGSENALLWPPDNGFTLNRAQIRSQSPFWVEWGVPRGGDPSPSINFIESKEGVTVE